MADVRPFPGLRYDVARAGDLSRVVCPPYDVIGSEERAALHARSPYNVVRLELGEDRPGDDGGENRYSRARRYLDGWLQEGILRRDAEPSLYLYEHVFDLDGRRRSRQDLLAAVRLHAWHERVVIPHEATMAAPKEDRLRLMRATAANVSPIMALYEDPAGAVAGALAEARRSPPVAAAAAGDTGEQHVLRRCADRAALRAVAAALGDRPLYIADGHHRYETALFYRDERRAQAGQGANPDAAWNFVMMLLIAFDDPGLVVLPTHRLVRGVEETRLRSLRSLLGRWFTVERLGARSADRATLDALLAAPSPQAGRSTLRGRGDTAGGDTADGDTATRRHGDTAKDSRALVSASPRLRVSASRVASPVVGLCFAGELYRLMLRPDSGWAAALPAERSQAWKRLDVAIADTLVLEHGCGLDEQARHRAEQVAYTRDAAEAVSEVQRGAYQLAVLLRPTGVEPLRAVADAGDRMPQKSTYFYPKPMTGLVLHELEGRREAP